MVMSRPTLEKLFDISRDNVKALQRLNLKDDSSDSRTNLKLNTLEQSLLCPSGPDRPDDMAVGRRMRMLGIPTTHAVGFHQRRPWDYNLEGMESQRGGIVQEMAISYHNVFSQTKDPVAGVLRKWML